MPCWTPSIHICPAHHTWNLPPSALGTRSQPTGAPCAEGATPRLSTGIWRKFHDIPKHHHHHAVYFFLPFHFALETRISTSDSSLYTRPLSQLGGANAAVIIALLLAAPVCISPHMLLVLSQVETNPFKTSNVSW